MFRSHPSFREPPDVNVKLWRYLDLGKFVALLQDRALFFARADKLGDPFEGSVPKRALEDYREEMIARANATAATLPEDQRDAYLRTYANRDVVDDVTRKNRYRAFLQLNVSCWHMNDHESAAMWSTYGEGGSICIQSSYTKLSEALPDRVFLGSVEYIDYDFDTFRLDNVLNSITHKRKSFEHERELRAVLWADNSVPLPEGCLQVGEFGYKLPVDLERLLDRTLISPTAPMWFADVVKRLMEAYDVSAPVLRSTMLATPQF